MAALTRGRTPRRIGNPAAENPLTHDELPVKGGEIIYLGAMVCRNAAGNVVPASAVAGLYTLGNYRDSEVGDIVATGLADGVKKINHIELGAFECDNGVDADAITKADVGKSCYWLDDHTVAIVSTDRSLAGKIYSYDSVTNKVGVKISL